MGKIIVILLGALIFEAVGVVFLSRGLKEIGPGEQWSVGEGVRLVGRGVSNRWILLGVLFEAIFFGALLVLLARADVSLVWPLTSLGFVLTTLAAWWFGKEHVSALRWTGVVFIVIGAMIVGWSEKRPAAPRPPAAKLE